jgi:hypothetical protein
MGLRYAPNDIKALEPSPGILFQYVSSYLFGYECVGLRYAPYETKA